MTALPAVASMQAGVDLDRLVAERVMGWKAEVDKHGEWRVVDGEGARQTRRDVLAVSFDPRTGERRESPWSDACDVPAYSFDIADAWLVVERMQSLGYDVEMVACNPGVANVWWVDLRLLDRRIRDCGDTAPLAICRAAARAIG